MFKSNLFKIVIVSSGLGSTSAYCAEKIPHFIDYYSLFAEFLGLSKEFTPVLASLFVLLITCVVGFIFKKTVLKSIDDVRPSLGISLKNLIEPMMEFLYSLSKEHCGKNYRRFLPLLAGLFVYILFSNLSGLIPGFPPATENFSTNLALGFIAFLCYNYAGIKEHGFSYIKQFTGPFLILAPLFLMIELVSHSVRPLSLAFRLLANIFCDHLLVGVFSGLVPLVVPSLFLFFGLLVAVIQSFVFTLLTGIYINMAISHDH